MDLATSIAGIALKGLSLPINKKDNLILKVLYHRIGKWEYRVKSFE